MYLVSSKLDNIELNATGAKSVLQNIAIILSTSRLSVPLYREFGISTDFIDKPTNISKPLLIAEIIEQINKYEPRAKVLNVTIEDIKPGKVEATVEVNIDE